MILKTIAAGFAAMLLASPFAIAQERSDGMVVAQADAGASAYLGESRNVSSLSEQELKQRIRAGRQLMKAGTLSDADRKKVRAAVQAAARELKGRGGNESDSAAADNAPSSNAAIPQTAQNETPDNTKKKKKKSGQGDTGEQSAAAPQGQTASNAQAFLSNSTSLSGMDENALRERLRAGRQLMNDSSLSDNDRKLVRQAVQAVRQELKSRGKSGGQDDNADVTAKPEATGKKQTNASGNTSGQPSAVGGSGGQFLADTRAPAQLSEDELRQRMRTGRDLMNSASLAKSDRKKVQQMVRAARDELDRRGGKGGKAGTGGQEQAADISGAGKDKTKAAGGGSSAAADNSDSAKLDDQALRKRLQDARDQLSSGNLSQADKKALRQKLQADRRELRRRIASKNGGAGKDTDNQPQANWLQDKREAKALNDRELRARLVFYRTQLDRNDITPERKAQFRIIIDRDRQEFRKRAIAIKDDRVRKLKKRVAAKDLNIQVNINAPSPLPPAIWAAEADDQTIVRQLVRRPQRQFERRYTIQEVEAQPEVRQAMPAVEIDTVTFGFNEDFVREEQMQNLDRIGSILEEIVAEHPDEVFLIEGHTDAVGDDEYNLDLSRRRAEAIKAALTEYYDIRPENLATVGYGKRYLKIPTPEPEEENRRIAIRRITPAVGELQG
jgi:outer membrane protein OmpA-like peptidoglycan-associated protein